MAEQAENERGFPDRLLARDRATAKVSAADALTYEYIERLERVARAAFAYWRVTEYADEMQADFGSALYEALVRVNYLNPFE
jgi:hypothetical protein